MLWVALVLVVLGVLFLFIIPWLGLPVGVVGLLLLIWFFVAARRATDASAPPPAP
jgi:hypothetical protein